MFSIAGLLLLRLNSNDGFLVLLLLPVVIVRNNPIVPRTTYSLSLPRAYHPPTSSLSMGGCDFSYFMTKRNHNRIVVCFLLATRLTLTKRAGTSLPLLVIASRTKCGVYSTLFNCAREDVGDCWSSKDNDKWTRRDGQRERRL